MKLISHYFNYLRNSILLPWVLSGTPLLQRIQKHRTPLLDVFWRCVTVLGNELIYLVALPYLFWNFSVRLTFHVVMIWSVGFYLGSALKDLFCLPRPPSPPITRLESDYENEHGFPSTHALNALSLPLTIALYSLFFHSSSSSSSSSSFLTSFSSFSLFISFISPLFLPLLLVICFAALVSFSRLYLGVHSPADIWAGLALALALVAAWFATPLAQAVEDLSRHPHPLMPLLFLLWTLLTLAAYPRRTMNNPAFCDIAAINSTTCGIFVGGWQLPWLPLPHAQYSTLDPSLVALRSLAGYVGLVLGKVLLKALLTRLMTRWLRVPLPLAAHTPMRLDTSLAQKDFASDQPLTRAQEAALFAIKFVSYFYLGYFSVMGTATLFPLLSID